MRNVTVETKLTIELTRKDWQLYDTINPTEVEIMNAGLEKALNQANSPAEALTEANKVLSQYRQHGATDTEPYGVLDRLLRLRFPLNKDWS
jgi:hypothetical protein